MADPVTLAVVGGTIGAATSKDPLKGALLGAAGGYAGGALLGAGAAGGAGGAAGTVGAAGTTGATGLAASGGVLAPTAAGVTGASATSPLLATQVGSTGFGSLGTGFSSVGMPEIVAANPFSANAAFSAAVPSGAEASLGAKMIGYGKTAMSAINSNPKIAAMGMGMMQNAMTPRQTPHHVLQGQIQRGQIQAPQFAMARVQQRKPVSLLG